MTENNRKEYQRLYYLKNKDRLLKKNKEYYRHNKNKIFNLSDNINNKLIISRGPVVVTFD